MKFNQLQMFVNKGEVKYFTESERNDYYANQDSTIYSVSKRTGKVKVLTHTAQKHNRGYVTVEIKGKTTYVHKIIGDLFVFNPNPENFNEIDHISGDKSDNSVYNLRWTDRSGNMKFAYENGLMRNSLEKLRKITFEQANEIRVLYATGDYKQRELAEMYGIDRATVSHIVTFKTYVNKY